MVFCCILHCFDGKFVFSLAIYAVLSQNRFLQFTRFCVEKKLAQNSVCGEKMTNIRYASISIYVCVLDWALKVRQLELDF